MITEVQIERIRKATAIRVLKQMSLEEIDSTLQALKDENDQLTVRVAELELSGRPLATLAFNLKQENTLGEKTRIALEESQKHWDSIITKSPTQSLNDLKAQGAAEMLLAADESKETISTVSELVLFAESYINQLRQQGKE